MTQKRVDLVSIFQEVTKTLAENQQELNRADEVNQDHGSNMVTTFQTITKSVKAQKKKGASDSTALAYAASQLAKKSTSSSGQQYARNLSAAATQFKGKKVDERGAMDLLMTLIGGGAAGQIASQPAAPAAGGGDLLGGLVGSMMGGGTSQQTTQQQSSGGGDLLSSLLGGALGGGTSQPTTQQQPSGGGDLLSSLLGGALGGGASQPTTQQQPSGGGDLLSSLLGGVLGGGTSQQTGQQTSQGDGQIGLDDILQAAAAYMQAKQSGQSGLQALMTAFMAASRMGDSVHRQQSTQMVVNSFLGALTGGK